MTTPLVSTSSLTKKYGDVVALDRVDLQVRPGTVYGLIGPNGAGKTTMLGILAGLREASDGSVDIGTSSVVRAADRPLSAQ